MTLTLPALILIHCIAGAVGALLAVPPSLWFWRVCRIRLQGWRSDYDPLGDPDGYEALSEMHDLARTSTLGGHGE